MTPEQERKLDGLHTKVDGLFTLFGNLANNFAAHVAEDGKKFDRFEDIHQRTRRWKGEVTAWMRGERAARDPMPTLNPDDSGSMSLRAGPFRLSAKGDVAVRVMLAILAVALAGAGGYFYHSGTHPAQAHEAAK